MFKLPFPPYRCLSHRSSKRLPTWPQLNPSLKRHAPLDVHPEVQDALATNKPVVALETTLVTHGFPHPINLELSLSLEEIVRSTGCIPATIGIIGGRVKIGLQPSELERLADTKSNSSVVKISRRDIAPAIAMKADGGRTSASSPGSGLNDRDMAYRNNLQCYPDICCFSWN